ncbi:MAG TPA: MoaD/ThiS family protein [Galbitalea sp.]|jgi:molybdopterin converting factor small subunit
MVELRFFAAARDVAGAASITVRDGTLGSVLRAFESPLIAKCSLLVNGVAASDPSLVLVDGDQVDVLPPFAGG